MVRYRLLTITALLSIILLSSCQTSRIPTSADVTEPQIPADFTTYTEHGLFSISYPSDWQPAISEMGDIFEETKAMMEAKDPYVALESIAMLFYAGTETLEGYYPAMNIVTDIRSTGYWTIDEVFEASSRYDRENSAGYNELSI